MAMYVLSMVLIVVSNILYNICQKSTPAKVAPFAALFTTYLTAALICILMYFMSKPDKSLWESFKDLNWTSLVLGFSIIGLELGYLLAYRAGWKISVGSLVANIALAIALIPIGILLFKEGFEFNKFLGVIFCLIGLVLINR